MSVLGIDFGNDNCVMMIARKRGFDLAVNQNSNRSTPTLVGFAGPGEARNMGERAKSSMMSNIPTTVKNVKQYVGKDIAEITDRERGYQTATVVEGDREAGFQLPVDGNNRNFNASEVAAMMFQDLRDIAEKECEQLTVDCVVACPGYWTDRQRHALRDAARMVGFKVLRLVSEHAACAMTYGCNPKRDLPAEDVDPKVVLMLDVGNSVTQCSLVKFNKGKCSIAGYAADETLGGRDFDRLLFDHFADQFKEKFKIDIRSNKKASLRLLNACEAAKLRLSANTEAAVNVECIMEDTDVNGKITRDEFEAMAQPLFQKLMGIIEQIREQTGNPTINSLELMGGGSRIPAIEALMRENFPKPEGQEEDIIARSLILQDPVARGAALVAAQCSPLFKLYPFTVTDVVVNPVAFSWLHFSKDAEEQGEDDDEATMAVDEEPSATEEKTMTLFERCTPNPSSKLVTFQRKEAFELNAAYANPDELSENASPFIGKFTVSGIPEGKMSKIKVKIRMDPSSQITVESAEMVEVEYIEVEEPVAACPPEAAPEAEAEAEAEAEPEAEAEAAAEEPAAEEPAAEEEKPKMEKKRKKKTKKTPLTVTASTWEQPQAELQAKIEMLLELETADRLIHDTQDRKNAVESYVYSTRDDLDMHLGPFAEEGAKATFKKLLEETEDWLYGDGENCTKSEYVNKLKELKELGDPVYKRHKEAELRPKAVEGLQHAIESARSFVGSTDEAYAHIKDEDRGQVSEMADKHAAWLNEVSDAQEQKQQFEEPAFSAKQCEDKAKELNEITTRKANIPKPAPPEEKKEEENKEEENKEETKEGGDPDKEEAPAAEDPAADMEID